MSQTTVERGLNALAHMFDAVKAQDRAAFMPYFPIGYPSYDASLDAIEAMAAEGVDGFEIGIPFSDPLADGPTIQAATQKALENGTTVRHCLDAVQTLRERGLEQPMLLMGYANPFVAYGIERFVQDAKAAGADGLIVPDLPVEEAAMFAEACERESMALVFFLAPTSSPERMALVAQHARGMIYVVSLTGITGARSTLPEYLTEFIGNIRQHTDTPLALGFGISTPDQAAAMNGLVDAFIVGSAMVRAGGEGVDAVRQLAGTMRRALD